MIHVEIVLVIPAFPFDVVKAPVSFPKRHYMTNWDVYFESIIVWSNGKCVPASVGLRVVRRMAVKFPPVVLQVVLLLYSVTSTFHSALTPAVSPTTWSVAPTLCLTSQVCFASLIAFGHYRILSQKRIWSERPVLDLDAGISQRQKMEGIVEFNSRNRQQIHVTRERITPSSARKCGLSQTWSLESDGPSPLANFFWNGANF